MRKQQKIWLNEHANVKSVLPTMANTEPTSGVVLFTDWLIKNGVSMSGKAVDIGCGKGRNSTHLASLGLDVWAFEYIEPAIDAARKLAKDRNVSKKIIFELSEVDKPWKIVDNFFDIAVDSFSSIDIETKTGREICRDEMFRTLKIGGYALVNVCSAEDEWEKELIINHPGPEPNSTIWPQSGKFQKNYTKSELREFYRLFEIVELKSISKPAYKLGKDGIATNLWMVLRKN